MAQTKRDDNPREYSGEPSNVIEEKGDKEKVKSSSTSTSSSSSSSSNCRDTERVQHPGSPAGDVMTPAVPPVQQHESPSGDQLCSNVRDALQQDEQQRQQPQHQVQREEQQQTPTMRDRRRQQLAASDSITSTPNTTTRTLPVSLFIDDPTSPVAPITVAATAAAGAVVLDNDDAEDFLDADTVLSDDDDEHWLSPTAVGHYGGGAGTGSDGDSEFTWDEDSIRPSEAVTPALRGVHATAVEVMRRSSRMFETLGKGPLVGWGETCRACGYKCT